MELEESSKRMIAPGVATWDQVGVVSKKIPGLITVRKVANCGDLKRLSLKVKILFVLQVPKNSSELEGGKGETQWRLHEEVWRL